MTRGGMYVWTASAAGWFVIGVTVDSSDALLISLLCVCAAYFWNWGSS